MTAKDCCCDVAFDPQRGWMLTDTRTYRQATAEMDARIAKLNQKLADARALNDNIAPLLTRQGDLIARLSRELSEALSETCALRNLIDL